MSDIFGAAVDRQEGASLSDTWDLGESFFTYAGGKFRNMADPAEQGDYDYYPDRYLGWGDGGGVHWNSGIANLAFVLMVQGGLHPQNKTSIDVTPIDPDFDTSMDEAARIFYMANTACLTPSSNFEMARECTLLHAGAHSTSVREAWTAVGVGAVDGIPLEDGVTLTGQAANNDDETFYRLSGMEPGDTVTCSIDGGNGDADMFIGIDDAFGPAYVCTPSSGSSTENCSVGPARFYSSALIKVVATAGYSNLDIVCSITPPSSQSLTSGVEVSGIDLVAGELRFFEIDIPTGGYFSCALSGPNGDAGTYETALWREELSNFLCFSHR